MDTTAADAAISCWRAKYDYAFWCPVTAVREADTDGTPWTHADPGWTPLVQTPPYPDYVSGHACVSGAVSNGLGHLFGPGHLDLRVASPVTGT
ncbi:MAG: putative secreted protein, partial [Mycobacterium sp.]|nr:putative secreted protein [Mycobacterium sp.]